MGEETIIAYGYRSSSRARCWNFCEPERSFWWRKEKIQRGPYFFFEKRLYFIFYIFLFSWRIWKLFLMPFRLLLILSKNERWFIDIVNKCCVSVFPFNLCALCISISPFNWSDEWRQKNAKLKSPLEMLGFSFHDRKFIANLWIIARLLLSYNSMV